MDESLLPTFVAAKADTPSGSGAVRSLVGQNAGSFRLLRELGRGGMGTVYQGEHELIGSRVAVKVLHPHLATQQDIVERFFAEAKAVNLIGHENIVRIFDMSRMPTGEWYLVMEYLQGQPLNAFAQKPLAERTATHLLCQVLDALDAAHERNIVHRDVKPENVFVQPRADGTLTVKLLDFGIARFFGEAKSSKRSSAGLILGTPAFMAPEQWDAGAVDGRTDVYAVGVLGWMLATGKNPFGDLPLTELVLAQKHGPPPPPRGQMSDGYRAAMVKALSPLPSQRFASAAEMRDALRQLTAEKAATSVQLHTKDLSRFPISVSEAGRTRAFDCIDLSKAGAYVICEDALPALRAQATVVVTLPGGQLAARAEVVRVVTEELGAAWKLPKGFALQFLEPGRAFGEKLEKMLKDRLAAVPTPAGAGREDAAASQRLRELACRLTGDPYQLLDVASDAGFPDIRRRARMLNEELQGLAKAFLGPESRDRLRRLQEKAHDALWTLGDPTRRAEHDARKGNFRGVARCISAGLTTTELEKLRHAFVTEFPRNPSRAQMYRITGDLHASHGEEEAALVEYEKALVLDPLNVEVHRGFWALHRRKVAPQRAG